MKETLLMHCFILKSKKKKKGVKTLIENSY